MKQDNKNNGLNIRLIERNDNTVVAEIIRMVMTEFKAVGCGYSINDTEVDDMHAAYQAPDAAFYVVELDGQVLGCGGFGPLTGGDRQTCELRKMYFKSGLRGMGAGAKLLKLCLEQASKAGFQHCYLETMDDMKQARRLYGKYGFNYLDEPMGKTGHTSCGTWMSKNIQAGK